MDHCEHCKRVIDPDLKAAINLAPLVYAYSRKLRPAPPKVTPEERI
jgi:hypothetical protein